MSRMPRFRSRLVTPEQFQQMVKQRRDESNMQEDDYRRQCTGAYWRYASGVHRATGSHTPLDPPFILTDEPIDVAYLPTQRLSDPALNRAKTTDKLAEYHDPCSDSLDISAIQLSNSLKPHILASMHEHGGRVPCGIHLHPLTLLTLAKACPDGRYAGIIPLFPDIEVPVDKMRIEYN